MQQAVEDRVTVRYLNKVIAGEGLCVMVRQPVSLSDKIVIHCEGAVQVSVQFEAVVFRPSPGTILQGTVVSQSKSGVEIRLDECP